MIRFTPIRFKIAQTIVTPVFLYLMFCLLNLSKGIGWHLTDFETGAIVAAFLIRFSEVLQAIADAKS